MLKRVKREHMYTVGRNVNWGNHCGKQWRVLKKLKIKFHQFSSVAQSCLTLSDTMDCRTPGLPVHHQLPEFTQTHVHGVGDVTNHLILCHLLLLLTTIFPSIRVFSNESVLHIRCQSIGVSASPSVFPMNIQDCFPLGWTGWIS